MSGCHPTPSEAKGAGRLGLRTGPLWSLATGTMCRSALPVGVLASDDAAMTAASPELLVVVAVFVLIAVAVGTFAARLFMAASRAPSAGTGADQDA